MAEMKLQVEIEAPIKKVFNYIADVSTHPQYATFVASIKFLTTKRIGVGVKFVQVHHGVGTENPTEITAHALPGSNCLGSSLHWASDKLPPGTIYP